MNEDSMPSKRMVLEQQVSDAGEDLVRLAAAKDAEIATLTEQRDEWNRTANYWMDQVQSMLSLAAERDRAMHGLQEIADMEGAEDVTDYIFCKNALTIANAILDAKAAAETAPSLPETPEADV